MTKKIQRLSLFMAILLLANTKSWAQFSVRNTSGETIYAAVTYFEDGRWHTQGWSTIGNGESEELYSNALTSRYIYYYAFSKSREWQGTFGFCSKPNDFDMAAVSDPTDAGYNLVDLMDHKTHKIKSSYTQQIKR